MSDEPTLNMYRWLAYSTAIYQAQTLYLLVIHYNSMNLWVWFVGYFVFFGLCVPTIGYYCTSREQYLNYFGGLQTTIGVCNLVFLIVGLCSVVTLHLSCYNCLEVFKTTNDTCVVASRYSMHLDKSWCSETPYIIPSILLSVATYVSFMSARCARKLSNRCETSKKQYLIIKT